MKARTPGIRMRSVPRLTGARGCPDAGANACPASPFGSKRHHQVSQGLNRVVRCLGG
jgi:hypothetical protein